MAKIKLDLTNDKSESSSKFSTVPSGTYKVTLADSEFKNTTSGFGLTIGFMVEEGEHKGKLIRDFVNVKNATAWRYQQSDHDGLARIIQLTIGQSQPVLKISTLQTILIVPFSSPILAASLSSLLDSASQ